ncbi:DsbE family thiol:disulfide interchange protein [Altererythrobacter sp. SALINAS58]|uniref:DsbE family thiol:disulfide interchange protein n=1 Tax=Alteripontixanthobacter muriae TaxID=2705546 RepID=UPI001576EBB5|nr:DsbE family thiol:disulfide interchange protein [Alteripontixanthobacter muriae]NTZ42382.1 DsbE family thiol:disulfide interchange protein [Alteripontixanthobacter muriae]
MKRLVIIIALLGLAGFVALAAVKMQQPRDDFVRSAMIGQPLPAFALPAASSEGEELTQADFRDGTPRLLNVWASWCVPCIAEAPQLSELQRQGADIVGVAINDTPENIAKFLADYGDPYSAVASDRMSQLQLKIGSSGVPETFVIDGDGVIRYQHLGDIMERDVPVLMAELRKAGL